MLLPRPLPRSPDGKCELATWGIEVEGLPVMGVAEPAGDLKVARKAIEDPIKGHRQVFIDSAGHAFAQAGREAPHKHPRVPGRRDAQEVEFLDLVRVLGELVPPRLRAIGSGERVQLMELIPPLRVEKGLSGPKLDR